MNLRKTMAAVVMVSMVLCQQVFAQNAVSDPDAKKCADYFTVVDPAQTGIGAAAAIAACKAAKQGHDPVSLRLLAIAFVSGHGVPVDKKEGMRLLESAMRNGGKYAADCKWVDGPAVLYLATMLWQGEASYNPDALGPTVYFPRDPRAPESDAQKALRLINASASASCISLSKTPEWAELADRLHEEISKTPRPRYDPREQPAAGGVSRATASALTLAAMVLMAGFFGSGGGSWECHVGTPVASKGEVQGVGGTACGPK
jgi:TPR repeat protein